MRVDQECQAELSGDLGLMTGTDYRTSYGTARKRSAAATPSSRHQGR